jgi:hypothetical protein
MPPGLAVGQTVEFTIRYEHGHMTAVSTNAPLINQFLEKVRLTRSLHTWINYTHDLKVFFTALSLPLEHIDRVTVAFGSCSSKSRPGALLSPSTVA